MPKYKLNISIDDISPHPKSSAKVLDSCYHLINQFPLIKFTLFCPTAYRLNGEQEYQIDIYPEFCNQLRSLSPLNFELGWHGHFHDLPGYENFAKDVEFRSLSYIQTENLFEKMYEITKKAQLFHLFKPVFRPPAFRFSEGVSQYCKDKNIKLSLLEHITSNPPRLPLRLSEKIQVLYHACEWDKSYLSNEMTKVLEDFIKQNIDNIDFVFIGELL